MEQFEIEPSTGDDLSQNIKNVVQEEKNDLNKVYDDFDPINCLLACSFKMVAITLYLTMKLLTNSYLTTFVLTVLLTAFDFWVTKNLTARKLVGLRWWSEVCENGQQLWVFESRNPSKVPHQFNLIVFWFSQFSVVLFWLAILILNLIFISIFWIGLAFFCQLLSLINFGCFLKCRGEHQKKVQEIASKMGLQVVGNIF